MGREEANGQREKSSPDTPTRLDMPQIQLLDDRGSSRLTPLLDPCTWQTSLSEDSSVTLGRSVKVQSGERGRDRSGLTLCLSIIVIHPDSCELRVFGDIIGEILFQTTSSSELDITSASREVSWYGTREGKGGGSGEGLTLAYGFLSHPCKFSRATIRYITNGLQKKTKMWYTISSQPLLYGFEK